MSYLRYILLLFLLLPIGCELRPKPTERQLQNAEAYIAVDWAFAPTPPKPKPKPKPKPNKPNRVTICPDCNGAGYYLSGDGLARFECSLCDGTGKTGKSKNYEKQK